MPANNAPIFPAVPVIGIASLTAAAPITSRSNITGTTGLRPLTPASTNGKRIDAITIKGKGTTVASVLGVWLYDGTTAYLFDEIDVAAITASTTVGSFEITVPYANLVVPATHQLLVSQTVQTDVNVFALGGDY